MSNGGSKNKSRGRLSNIQRMLGNIERQINREGKANLADYVRLVQLEQQLNGEEPVGEIQVTWVDTDAALSEG